MSVPRRFGVTVPLGGLPLHELKPWYEELAALGYTDLWSAEAGGHEGLVPLALAAAWTPTLRLGTAILPVYTRGAATLAEATASMCQAAPGRFALGIGCSSPTIVENWNAVPFEKPYQRVRDTLRFLRAALSGEKVTEEYETFSVKGFRLGAPVADIPPLLVAALRPGMLRPMWDAWNAGDRAAATEAIPDELVDALVVHGSPADCRAHLARYVENGVTTPAPMILGSLDDTRDMIRALAPTRLG